jgi:hypothetical protein
MPSVQGGLSRNKNPKHVQSAYCCINRWTELECGFGGRNCDGWWHAGERHAVDAVSAVNHNGTNTMHFFFFVSVFHDFSDQMQKLKKTVCAHAVML